MSAGRAALGALLGACIGWGLWEAAARTAPEADRARWSLRGASVPVEPPDAVGPLRPDPSSLDLWANRGSSPKIPPFDQGSVRVAARVPTDGQLLIQLGANTVAGPEQPTIDEGPVEPPDNAGGPPGRPGGPGGPGGAAHGPMGRPPQGGPPAREPGVTLVVDRSSRNALFGRGLTCTPAAAPGESFTLELEARAGEVVVAIDGREATRCRGQWAPGAVVISSGLKRVQVASVAIHPSGGAAFEDDFGGPLRSWGAGAVAAVTAAALGSRIRRRAVLAVLLPVLLLPVLPRLDMRGLLDTLRLLRVPDALGPLLLVGLPVVSALVFLAGGTARSLRGAALRGLAGVVVGAAVAALAPKDALGWLLLGGLGVPMAVLGWINHHPFPRRVSASYALFLVLAVGAELGARATAVDASWTRTAGWRRASEEFAELIELRRYRTYPDEGFPVRPPEPDPHRRRIVALGGSSTGGAWQMDDLDKFWPRKLQDRLQGTDWEVVNQGVGGWNTLHMRLYVESQIERLDADLFVIYAGHNDILSKAPVSYRELYASWRDPGSGARAVADALNQSRLYNGLKFALLALREQGGAVAVPVSDARENLQAIARLAGERGARLLLVNEGLNPDPLPMRPYGAMMAEVAAETGNAYLDGATRLWEAEDPDIFLDDCHLTVHGHERLAAMVDEALRAQGWLGPAPASRGSSAPPPASPPPSAGASPPAPPARPGPAAVPPAP
jgi:lysophospholipase L1-like esterase